MKKQNTIFHIICMSLIVVFVNSCASRLTKNDISINVDAGIRTVSISQELSPMKKFWYDDNRSLLRGFKYKSKLKENAVANHELIDATIKESFSKKLKEVNCFTLVEGSESDAVLSFDITWIGLYASRVGLNPHVIPLIIGKDWKPIITYEATLRNRSGDIIWKKLGFLDNRKGKKEWSIIEPHKVKKYVQEFDLVLEGLNIGIEYINDKLISDLCNS